MKSWRLLLLVLYFGSFSDFSAFAQSEFERIPENKESVKSVVVVDHSPRKASLYSAVLPGLGQAYNKKYWKIPIVYAGFGVFGYFIYFNASHYNEYKQAYIDFIDDEANTNSYLDLIGPNVDPGSFDPSQPSDSYSRENEEWFKTQLENNMNFYKRYRDLSVILTAGWYVLTIIDATVDAYLLNYDISHDISLRVDPKLFSYPGKYNTVGLQFSLKF